MSVTRVTNYEMTVVGECLDAVGIRVVFRWRVAWGESVDCCDSDVWA